MNRAAITIAAILLSVGSTTAQESTGDLSKDRPNLEWPQAGIQPYSLNFEMPKFIEQKDTASTATAIQLNSPTFGRKLQLEPEAPKFRFNQNPYAFDFNTSGAIATWDNGALIGAGNRTTLPGLYSNQQASFSAVQQFGDLTLSAGVSADRYQMFQGPDRLRTQFGVHGNLSYRFSDNLSLHLFGSYYNQNPFYTVGALPYINTTNFGGYFDVGMGEHFGMMLGGQATYDTMTRRMLAAPIVMPYVKINDVKLGVDVGWLIRDLLIDAFAPDSHRQNPTIAPPVAPMPPIR